MVAYTLFIMLPRNSRIPPPAPTATLPVCAPYICPGGDTGIEGIGLRGAGVTLFSKSA